MAYTSKTYLDTLYQSVSSNLTTLAGITYSTDIQSLLASANYSATRTNLGLAIGTNVQAYDADLTTWAGLTPSANAQSLITAANYATMRGLLDLETGIDFYSIAGADAIFQPLDSDLTTIAGLTATTDNFLVSVASAWASRTPAQVKSTLSLNNVDNTSDANKPISTATQTALNLKASLISPTLVTPVLGVATATSINKITLTPPATSAVLTIVDGVTLTVSANTTLSGTPLSNPMTTLGDVIYGGVAGVATRLVGDTTNTRKFLRTLSIVGVSDIPAWDTLQAGDIPDISGTYQPLDSDLTTIAGLIATTNNFIVSVASAWASRTPAQVKAILAIINTDISGLGTLSTQNGTFSGTSSGTNTGDQTSIVGITGTKAQFDTAVSDGNILYVGDVTQYTDEAAQDAVGAMIDATLIYNDGAPSLTVASAPILTTGRTIGGVSFNGSTNIVPQTIQSINEATDTTCFPLFISASGTQSLQPLNNVGFTYNSNTNALTVTTFIGALTGTASGNLVSGGVLGTPSSGTLTNCTFPTLNQNTTGSAASLSVSGQTGLVTMTGLASTNRIKTVRDAADTILELGGSYTPTGIWTSLTMVTPVLGTPTSGNLANCTFPTLNQATTNSAGSLKSVATTGLMTVTGMGVASTRAKTVRDADDTVLELGGSYTPTGTWTSLTMVTPVLGTPASGVVTNLTGTASININGTVGATSANTIIGTSITANTGFFADADDGSVLGASGTAFSDLFLALGAVINFNAGNVTITHAAGLLTIAGAELTLATGTATSSPLNIPAGTLETTPEDGDIEMDANCFYVTTDAGNRGVVPVENLIRQHADRAAFANNTNQQAIFDSVANGTLTLETGAYLFEALIQIKVTSATSGNLKFSLVGAGGGTFAIILYSIMAIDAANDALTAWSGVSEITSTQVVANMATATTATVSTFLVKGSFECTVAGTLIPSVAQTSAVTTAVTTAGSYFKCNRIGATTGVSVGQWS